MATSQHVIPSPKGGWSVRKGGAEKASRTFDDKQKAIDYARIVSRNQGSELYIHGRDGAVQHKDSHGKDPAQTKDHRDPIQRIR